ncbi:unnamed protein product, partial [Nesidiocoris tenuis]
MFVMEDIPALTLCGLFMISVPRLSPFPGLQETSGIRACRDSTGVLMQHCSHFVKLSLLR